MKRIASVLGGFFVVIGLLGCTGSGGAAGEPEAAVVGGGVEEEQGAPSEEGGDEAEPDAGQAVPEGARPGSAGFPFPVPVDWEELEPFQVIKIGKDPAMAAAFIYPGDADAAAESYQELLEAAGFTIHPNPLGDVVNAASFIAEGLVDGVAYSGTLDFDEIADGTPRVAINLTAD